MIIATAPLFISVEAGKKKHCGHRRQKQKDFFSVFSGQTPFTVLSKNFISGVNESAAVSDATVFTRAVTFYAEPSALSADYGEGEGEGERFMGSAAPHPPTTTTATTVQ